MNKPKTTLEMTEQAKNTDRRILEVPRGSTSGMDEESITAVATLLQEIEARQALVYLLQTHQVHGRIEDNGQVRVICM